MSEFNRPPEMDKIIKFEEAKLKMQNEGEIKPKPLVPGHDIDLASMERMTKAAYNKQQIDERMEQILSAINKFMSYPIPEAKKSVLTNALEAQRHNLEEFFRLPPSEQINLWPSIDQALSKIEKALKIK